METIRIIFVVSLAISALLILVAIRRLYSCPKCGKSSKQLRTGVKPGNDKETAKCQHCGYNYYMYN